MRKSFKIEYFKDDFERPAFLKFLEEYRSVEHSRKSGATIPSTKEF
jgi:hypothetical protein